MNEHKNQFNILFVFLIVISFILSSIFLQSSRNNDNSSLTHPNFTVNLMKAKISAYYYYNDDFTDDTYIITNYSIPLLNNDNSIDQKTSCKYSESYANYTEFRYNIVYALGLLIIVDFTDIFVTIFSNFNATHGSINYQYNTYYFEKLSTEIMMVCMEINDDVNIIIDIYTNSDTYNYIINYTESTEFSLFNLQICSYLILYYQNDVLDSNIEMIESNTLYNIVSANIFYYNIIDNTTYFNGRYKLSLSFLYLTDISFYDIGVYVQQDSELPVQFLSQYQTRIIEFNAECYCYILVLNSDINDLENYIYWFTINFMYYPSLLQF